MALLGMAVATGLAACGDGGDDEGSSGPDAACRAQAGVNTGFIAVLRSVPGLSPFSSPEEEESAQIRSAYDANVAAPLAALVANAPGEIAEAVRQVAATGAEFRSTGDHFALQDDDFARSTDIVDAYMQENCEGSKATVEAVDHAYQGLPRTLPAGTVRLALENTGAEAHEMALFVRRSGVTESFDALLALRLDQGRSELELVELTRTDPGQTGYLVADLTAGDYIVICEIGKGTTDYGDPTGAEPHHTLGMRQEVTVT